MTKQTDMSPTEIRIAMLKTGVTQAGIARELDVDKSAVHLIIEGRAVSDRIRRKIAERVGLDVAVIWPSTYRYGSPRKAGRPFCHAVSKAAGG